MHAAPDAPNEGAAPPDRFVPPRWLSEGAERLAHGDPRPRFDVVVIGSGYGGAVAAARFSAMRNGGGRKLAVAVLERGDEYVPGSFPDRFSQVLPHLRASRRDDGEAPSVDAGRAGLDHALFDFHIGEQVSALVGNGLGGGSLINAGVVEAPEAAVFEDTRWPREIRAEAAAGAETWQRHFYTAKAMLAASKWAGAAAKSDALFRGTAALQRHVGAPIVKVRPHLAVTQTAGVNAQGVDQAECIACGNCVTGCNFWAKNTLPMNYLAEARRRGARLFTGATVLAVRPMGEATQPDGDWLVTYRLTHDRRDRNLPDAIFEIVAGRVVLAAGTFGSSQILGQSSLIEPALRHLSQPLTGRLGQGISCNGDGIAAAYDQVGGAEPVRGVGADPTVRHGARGRVGPTITGMLDLRGRTRMADRFMIQDAAIPFALKRIYEELLLSFAMVHRMTTWNDRDDPGRAVHDPLVAAAERLDRSQFLLFVGHDDAGWRLDFQRTRSEAGVGVRAVPLVVASIAKRPADEMASVRARQRAMNETAACLTEAAPSGGGGLYIPNPAWQPAPADLLDALRPQQDGAEPGADPLAAERLLTVHPLGGCTMADSGDHGVVDHLGRVFRAASTAGARDDVFANLVVMDGSTIPCSLGINPLLTICALAERSCEGLRVEWQLTDDPTPPAALPPQPGRVDPMAWRPTTTAVLFNETMDGPLSLVVNKNVDLRRLSESERNEALDARAELRIRAEIDDLGQLVGDPQHEIAKATGELKLFWKGSESRLPPFDLMPVLKAATTASGRVLEPIKMPVTVRLLELLPSGVEERTWRALRHWWSTRGRAFLRGAVENRILRKLAELALRAILSIDGARPRSFLRQVLEWLDRNLGVGGSVLSMAKIASHHGEARAMTYELQPLEPEHTPFRSRVRVLAAKRIHYGPSTGYRQRASKGIVNPHLPRWVPSNPWRAVVELQVLMVSEVEGRPLVEDDWPTDQRPGWLDPKRYQVVATGTWSLDLQAMITRDVPQLVTYQTLPDAWLDMASFATFIGRTLLQSYFWSWRLPAYPAPLSFGGADLGPLPGFRLGPDGKTYVEMPGRGVTWEQRRVGLPGAALGGGSAARPAEIVLTHFWPAKAAPTRRQHPVVMFHGFVTSGYQFATPRLKTNAVEWLTAQGFDVWVVDLRTSIAVASSHEAWDFDTVASVDIPTAIDTVLAASGAAQVHVVAHCMGSAAFNMAVLAGRLTRDNGQSKVRSAVQTLVSMDVVSTPPNRLKASALRFVEDIFQAEELRVTADREVLQADRIMETIADRLLMTWPKNDVDAELQADNELWKPRADFIASVNRINALYGRNFSHQNMSADMLGHLHEVFRHANVRTFRHVLHFHRAGRVVDRHGNDAYVTDHRIRDHYRFPVRFLHGQFGAVFSAASTRRSRIRLDRLLPEYVHERKTLRATRDAKGRPVRPNWGHFDIWLSEHSAAEVFPSISEFLAAHDGPPPVLAKPPPAAPIYRYEPPDLGPWLGWWRPDPVSAKNGIARIWFRSPYRDENRVEVAVYAAKASAPPGTRLQSLTAWQLVDLQQRCGVIDVSMEAPEKDGAWGLAVVCRSPQATWFAEGDLSLRLPTMGPWWSIDLKSLVVQVAPLVAMKRARREAPGKYLTGQIEISAAFARLLDASIPKKLITPSLDRGLDRSSSQSAALASAALPAVDSLPDATSLPMTVALSDMASSPQVAISPELASLMENAATPAGAEEAIAAAAGEVPPIIVAERLFAQLRPGDRVAFLLASCRYQATEMEAVQANRSLLSASLDDSVLADLDFAMLVGDQIYADASYGVFDGRPSSARLRSKYTSLWAGSAGEMGRRLPLYLCGDDHELRDDWFDGVRTSADQAMNDYSGFSAMDAYQYAAMPDRRHGPGLPSQACGYPRRARDYGFESAGFRIYVLDSRFERGAPGSAIWSEPQRAALAAFLIDAGKSDPTRPVFIASSVPVFPFSRGLDGIEDELRSDHWQSYPTSFAELLHAIVDSDCQRVVLLSGDRHLSQHARGTLRATDGSGRVVEIDSIVSSGLNAPIPFANKNPGDLIAHYAAPAPGLPDHELRYAVIDTKTTDGWARVEVKSSTNGWSVSANFR